MLTRIGIENFKGLGDRVILDLRPITLLFGPNSAGKGTVLQALQYARDIFERRNLDPYQTAVGGKLVDLGGFNSFVHNHDLSRTIVLRILALLDRQLFAKKISDDLFNCLVQRAFRGSCGRVKQSNKLGSDIRVQHQEAICISHNHRIQARS